MDIGLFDKSNGTQIEPTSVHGMLWLQTHFEITEWEAISSQQVVLSKENSELLLKDATQAGLTLNSFTSIAYSSK